MHDLERAASMLVGAGFALYALKSLSLRRAPVAVVGAALLHRGVTGRCPTYRALGIDTASGRADHDQPITVDTSITINRSGEEVFRLWKQPETLGRLMEGFAELKATPEGATEWNLLMPLGQSVRFTTRMTEEREPALVRWSSGAGDGPRMEGTLELSPAPRDWGTQVRLRMTLEPPGGSAGRALVKLLRSVPKMFAEKALRRLKSLAETGELPTLHHNPAARHDGRDS